MIGSQHTLVDVDTMTTLTSMCFTALLAAYIEQGFASPCKNDVCRMTKGDMFTMHCSTADLDQDHLTLYARLPKKQVLVEYDLIGNYTVSKDYNKRLKISGTIHKITMTISDLQLSDSGLYIGEYTKYDSSKQQEVKEESCYIVLIVNALLAAYIEQGFASPCKNDVCRMTKGDMFTMHCSTADLDRDHLTLYARLPKKQVLVEYDLTGNYIVSKDYNKTLKISGTIHKITMTISDLQLSDSGLYIGEYTKYDSSKQQEVKEESCYIVLIVNDVDLMLSNGSLEKSTSKGLAMNEPVMLVLGLTAGTMLIVFLLVMWVLYPKVKAQCRKKTDTEVQAQELSSPVYEDMHRLQHG